MTTTRELTAQEQRRIAKTLFFAAACLYLLACYLAYGQWQLNRTALLATGEVISFTGKNGRFPIVRFEAPDGGTHTFRERRSSAFTPIHLGDHVDVMYPPDRPQEAWVVKTQWLGARIPACIATIVSGVGLLALSIPGWRLRQP